MYSVVYEQKNRGIRISALDIGKTEDATLNLKSRNLSDSF
jgi:hypothetical protein